MRTLTVVLLGIGLLVVAPLVQAEEATACIDVESASAKQLEQLKGVGPALAKAIVDHRQAMRTKATKAKKKKWNFQNWARLMKVKGVGVQICKDNLVQVCFSGKPQKACPQPPAARPGKAKTKAP
jgi:DNA uptake protein ComE-like DNA-binding protein